MKASVKSRFVLSFCGLALSLSLIYSAITLFFLYILEDVVIDQMLRDEGHYLATQVRDNPDINVNELKPRLDNFVLYLSVDDAPAFVREELRNDPQTEEIFGDENHHYQLGWVELKKGQRSLLLGEVSSYLVMQKVSMVMALFMLSVLLSTMLVSLWVAYSLAKRLTQPIEKLSQQVKLLEHGEKNIVIAAMERQDEIGYLARSLNDTFLSLQQSLQRETDFTSDVSHELRTPVTILKNALSSGQGENNDENNRVATQALNGLDSTLEILLALARAENLNFTQVRLAPLIESILLQMMELSPDETPEVELEVSFEASVVGNENLMAILVKNLIQNALNHGSALAINYHQSSSSTQQSPQQHQLIFSNIMNNPLPLDVMTRGVKSVDSQGFGHGLYLIERIINVLKWQYRIEIKDGRFCFLLMFGQG